MCRKQIEEPLHGLRVLGLFCDVPSFVWVRVPIEQGYQLYMALKRQNVPTRMLILPRQPHGPNEPKMQIAAMQSNLDWFEKYLK